MQPNISVIIPYYNQRNYAEDLLANIRSYMSPKVEVIIADDCSTDGSADFFQRRVDGSKLKYFRQPKNIGPRANAQLAAERAEGKYLIFSAGDDFMIPGAFLSIQKLIEDNNLLLIFRGFRSVREEIITYLRDGKFKNEPRKLNNFSMIAADHIRDFLFYAATIPGYIWVQGICINKKLFERTGFPPSGEVDDWGLLHNLFIEYIRSPFKVKVQKEAIFAASSTAGSFGSDALQQAERQLASVSRNWHPSLRVEAMHQVIAKKLLTNNKNINQTINMLELGARYLRELESHQASS